MIVKLNNDCARRDWLNAYHVWGVWFLVPQTGATWYRAYLPDGTMFAVEEYPKITKHCGTDYTVQTKRFYMIESGEQFDGQNQTEGALLSILHELRGKNEMRYPDCLMDQEAQGVGAGGGLGDCTMTTKEFAALLNGRECGSELTRYEAEKAKALGFVVVYGASDDLMEFEGAITDEVGCYDGGIAYLDGDELFNPDEDCEDCTDDARNTCKLYRQALSRCKSIEAVWSGESGITWTYKTDIPHESFDILEDGNIYCRGIVFELRK